MTTISEKNKEIFIAYQIYNDEKTSAQICQAHTDYRLTPMKTSCNGHSQNKTSLLHFSMNYLHDEPMDFSLSSKPPNSALEEVEKVVAQRQHPTSIPLQINDANEQLKFIAETNCEPLSFKDSEMLREELLLNDKVKCHARERSVLVTAGLLDILPPETIVDGECDDELIWKDGVGYLPGTSLRFHKSVGILEMIDDFNSSNCTASFTDDSCSNEIGEKDASYSAGKCSQNLTTCKSLNEEKFENFIIGDKAQTTCHQKPSVKLRKCENASLTSNSKNKCLFNWTNYLKETGATAAPICLFQHLSMDLNSTTCGFKRGMLLEGIDPQHASLYCVMSVAEVVGWRIRLHFEGYSELFDFWTNSYSPFIFASGWCSKNKRNLQPPKGQERGVLFDWKNTSLLYQSGFQFAPRHLFRTSWIIPSCESANCLPTCRGFHVGRKLEAPRKHNYEQICVATVADFLEHHILIHIDGCDSTEDYWTDLNSPYIHSIGWCSKNDRTLRLPIGWVSDTHQLPHLNDKKVQIFTWSTYLRRSCAEAVPESAFKPRCALAFEHGQKLEAVDPRSPRTLRVATVSYVEAHSLTIHFDGLNPKFDLKFNQDSGDIFPVGYAERSGHPLEAPFSSSANLSCPIVGCGGFSHMKRLHFTSNECVSDCPYSDDNLHRERPCLNRLQHSESGMRLLPHQRYQSYVHASCNSKRVAEAAATTAATAAFKKHHHLLLQFTSTTSSSSSANSRRKGRRTKCRNGAVPSNSSFAEVAAAAALAAATAATKSINLLRMEMEEDGMPTKTVVDHDEALFWAQQRRLLPAVDSACDLNSPNASDLVFPSISQWAPTHVANFVRQLTNCSTYAQAMLEHEVDGEAFLLLEHIDLSQCLGLPLGPVLKIASAIKTLRHDGVNNWVA